MTINIVVTEDKNIFKFTGGEETLHLEGAWIGCHSGGMGWKWELRGAQGKPLARNMAFCSDKAEAMEQGTDYVKRIRDLIAKAKDKSL